jgi:hypothetical protein
VVKGPPEGRASGTGNWHQTLQPAKEVAPARASQHRPGLSNFKFLGVLASMRLGVCLSWA